MKVYIVAADAYSSDLIEKGDVINGILLTSTIFNIFDSREKAVEYIENCWPEAKHLYDELFGEHWESDFSTQYIKWKLVYKIIEKDVK